MYEELFLLRLAVGMIFIYHAVPKLKEPKALAGGLGWHMNQVFALGIFEFIGGLSMIGGIGVPFTSLLLGVVMVGAIYHKINKWHVPFTSTSGTGWEFDFILLASCLTIYAR